MIHRKPDAPELGYDPQSVRNWSPWTAWWIEKRGWSAHQCAKYEALRKLAIEGLDYHGWTEDDVVALLDNHSHDPEIGERVRLAAQRRGYTRSDFRLPSLVPLPCGPTAPVAS